MGVNQSARSKHHIKDDEEGKKTNAFNKTKTSLSYEKRKTTQLRNSNHFS